MPPLESCPAESTASAHAFARLRSYFGSILHPRAVHAASHATRPPLTARPPLAHRAPIASQAKKFAADEGDSIVLCQAALGLKPKAGERVTVFIKTQDSPELAIGSLTMGTCDQFTLGTGLSFSAGETVTVRHNGSTSVFLPGRI